MSSEQCSEEGCERNVFARGLCSRHYQRKRREGFKEPAQPGRPREYPKELADPWGGAPRLSVRFPPELLAWAKERGGGPWVRHVVSELRLLSEEEDFKDWWERLQLENSD